MCPPVFCPDSLEKKRVSDEWKTRTTHEHRAHETGSRRAERKVSRCACSRARWALPVAVALLAVRLHGEQRQHPANEKNHGRGVAPRCHFILYDNRSSNATAGLLLPKGARRCHPLRPRAGGDISAPFPFQRSRRVFWVWVWFCRSVAVSRAQRRALSLATASNVIRSLRPIVQHFILLHRERILYGSTYLMLVGS